METKNLDTLRERENKENLGEGERDIKRAWYSEVFR
jgi:hypothetical protein